jgi:fructose/tagatose bisphosphate aldolase
MRKKRALLSAVNVTGSNTINGVLETAAKLNAPVIIQFSNGGAQFNAGKGSNENEKQYCRWYCRRKTHSYFSRSLWCNRNFTHGPLLKNYYLGLMDY